MNFDALAGMIRADLLGQIQQQAEVMPVSVVIYSCPNKHQAVRVKSGRSTFTWLSTMPPDGLCLRCMGQRGIKIRMK